jgi:hypothetical protein
MAQQRSGERKLVVQSNTEGTVTVLEGEVPVVMDNREQRSEPEEPDPTAVENFRRVVKEHIQKP